MSEKMNPESGPNPDLVESNRLVVEHKRLDREFDEAEAEIDSFFKESEPFKYPEDDEKITGLIAKRDQIFEDIQRIEQELFDLDTK